MKNDLCRSLRYFIRISLSTAAAGFAIPSVILVLLLPLPSTAQTAESKAPAKWPDQSECREIFSPDNESDNKLQSNLLVSGWCVAIDDRRGNCIACHTFNVSPWPVSLPIAGNLAPPMVAIRARFPDSKALRGVIEDASSLNPRSSMPPYLKHQILSSEEIDHLIAFLGTL